MKIRINQIVEIVNRNIDKLIDVGSDHCLLAIELLLLGKCKHVINIEKNEGPHHQGIDNLKRKKLLHKTTNIINDGLKNIDGLFNFVDTIVISGMGTNNILNILKNSKVNFNQLVIQSNSDLYELRKYIVDDLKLLIRREVYIKENNIIYVIFDIVKSNELLPYNDVELFFGKESNIVNNQLFYELWNNRLKYLHNNKNILTNNKKLNYEYFLLQKRLKNDN